MSSSESVPSARTAPPAVVVGLDSITGLQTARILADRSVEVHGVVADRRHWGARTNACVEVVESPLAGPGLVAALTLLGRRLDRPAVLLPCSDAAVDTVSRHRDQLADEGYLLALSDHPVVELLMDKVRFARYAEEQDLPLPRTELLTDRSDAGAVAASIGYPCVLKPPYKTPAWLAHTSAKGFTVEDPRAFLEVYRRVEHWVPFLLAQEWIPGTEDELYSCNAVFGAGGRPLATFVARKVRQWPPDIGTSASGEECRNDEVLDTTVRLFGGLGYRGLAYLEMKRDARTGRMCIVEPNVGRPTGRSAIAEAGGVELVHTAYCDAAGLPLPDAREQRYGDARWLDLRRDLQAALVARRRGTLTLRAWLHSVRGPTAHAIWSRRDPMPFVVDVAGAARTGLSLLRARRAAGQAAARRRADRGRGLGMNQRADVTGVVGWGLRRYAWLIALFVIALGVVIPGVIEQRAEQYQATAQVGPVRTLRISNVDVLPKMATDVFSNVLTDPLVKQAAGATGPGPLGADQVEMVAAQDNIVFTIVAHSTDPQRALETANVAATQFVDRLNVYSQSVGAFSVTDLADTAPQPVPSLGGPMAWALGIASGLLVGFGAVALMLLVRRPVIDVATAEQESGATVLGRITLERGDAGASGMTQLCHRIVSQPTRMVLMAGPKGMRRERHQLADEMVFWLSRVRHVISIGSREPVEEFGAASLAERTSDEDTLVIVNDASPVDVATRPERSLTLLVVNEGISRSALHEQARQYVDGGSVAMVLVRQGRWLSQLRSDRPGGRAPFFPVRSSSRKRERQEQS